MLAGKKRFCAILVLCLVMTSMVGTLHFTTVQAASISIASYGATANDSTDDTTAINNAINAASSGDTVYFPSGTFLVSSPILAKQGVKLMGESQSDTVIRYIGTSTPNYLQSGEFYGIIHIRSVSNVEITRMTLDGNSNLYAWQGICGKSSSNNLIHHVTIKNLVDCTSTGGWGPHGIFFDTVTDSKIFLNTIVNIGVNSDWGVGIRVSANSSRNDIYENTVIDTGRGGIMTTNGCQDCSISRNLIAGSGKKTEGLGIEVFVNCNNNIVEDNVVDHWISFCNSGNLSVRRNYISDTSGVFKYAGIELVGTTDSIITDNVVYDGQNFGIVESGDPVKQYMYLGYNTVQLCNQWGAYIQGDANWAKYQYFYSNGFFNTRVGYANPPYPGSEGTGLRFNGNCDYLTFENCNFSYNGKNGVEFGSPASVNHLSFVNNSVSNNAGSAFGSYSGYTALELSGNTVANNGNNSTPAPAGFNNLVPVAVINCPDSGNVGQSISFSSGSSDPDGSISHVLWDFNDGTPSTATTTNHTFNSAGKYRVTLIVWDNYGRAARTEKTVIIGTTAIPTMKIDDYDTRVTYSGAGWGKTIYETLFHSTQHFTNTTNSYSQFSFNGSSVKWIGTKAYNRGKADVYIDNVYQTTVDMYDPGVLSQQVLYENTSLAGGDHIIKVVCKGQKNASATDYYIDVDAFEYSRGPVKINDNNSNITYGGSTWEYISGYSTLYCSDQHYSNVTNNYAQYTFYGTSIAWIGAKAYNRGKADVYIDNVYQTTIDLYDPGNISQQVLYQKTGLSLGNHTIKVVCKGQKNSSSTGYYIDVDAFESTPY